MTLAGDPDSQTRPFARRDRRPGWLGQNRALVEAATFSPKLADLTMTASSIESRRDAQHAQLRARRHLIYGPKEGDSR
jgi:hypothetical protein